MCDFNIYKAYNKTTNEVDISNNIQQHMYKFPIPFNGIPGFYSIGATGVGIYYFDGNEWLRPYLGVDERNPNIEFHTVGKKNCLSDIKEYKNESTNNGN